MTTYRKADGTALTAAEVKQRTTQSNRIEGTRKAGITRGNNAGRSIPTLHAGITATEYVRQFDSFNGLKPCAYAWQNPNSHYGFVDSDPVDIREAT